MKEVDDISREFNREPGIISKLSVKPIIVTGFRDQLVKLLNKKLHVGVKANDLIINDCNVKSL